MNSFLIEYMLNEEKKEQQIDNLIIESAKDGFEAVEKCKLEKFDLILMDYHMPRMNGVDATIEIRKLENFKTVPICFVSADTSEFLKDEIKEIKANGLIDKPISKKDIQEIFKNYILD